MVMARRFKLNSYKMNNVKIEIIKNNHHANEYNG
jgi:hypothetical protein